MKRIVLAIVLLATVVMSFIVPSLAQDSTPIPEGEMTIVTGAVEFSSTSDIMVAGLVIAPASAFNPSQVQAGDLVVISGMLLNETTLQAVLFEFFVDEPEANTRTDGGSNAGDDP